MLPEWSKGKLDWKTICKFNIRLDNSYKFDGQQI